MYMIIYIYIHIIYTIYTLVFCTYHVPIHQSQQGFAQLQSPQGQGTHTWRIQLLGASQLGEKQPDVMGRYDEYMVGDMSFRYI